MSVCAKEQQDTAFMTLYRNYFELYHDGERETDFWKASDQLKDYYRKHGNTDAYYKIRQNEVLYQLDQGRTYQAIKTANEILDEMKEDGTEHYDIVYASLATIYESRGNYRMAKHYFEEGLRGTAPTDSGALISIYSRLASLEATREPQEAWQWNERFGQMTHKYPDYYKVYLAQKGEISFFMGDREKFMKSYREFNDYINSHRHVDDYGKTIMDVANKAMDGHYEEALEKTFGDQPDLDDIGWLDVRGKIYEMMGRYDLALKVSAERRDMRDSLNSDLLFENLNAVNAEMGLFKIGEKAAKERERWLIAVIVLLLIGIGLIVWRHLTRRLYQRRLLKQNKDLEVALSRAEESDRMKTSFIEHVSHEIRTPLNVITGFSQIITNPDYELDKEERDHMLCEISRNTVEITNIVNELLEVSDDESRHHYERNDDIDIELLCQEVMSTASTINNGRLTLTCKNQLDAGQTMHSNRLALVKILDQLLKNALKFTAKGEVELKVRERAGHGGIEFTVTDTGIGIDPKYHDQIFDRFFKVDSFKQGMGLGLTLSRKIAELLGGTLDIDPSYKRGARFVLILPS